MPAIPGHFKVGSHFTQGVGGTLANVKYIQLIVEWYITSHGYSEYANPIK